MRTYVKGVILDTEEYIDCVGPELNGVYIGYYYDINEISEETIFHNTMKRNVTQMFYKKCRENIISYKYDTSYGISITFNY